MRYLNGGLNALFMVFLFSIRRTAMIKKLTIYMFASFFTLLLIYSASARIVSIPEYNQGFLPDTGSDETTICPSGSSETPPKEGETCTQFNISSGLTCYKDCTCKSNYVKVDGVCTLNDCSAYPKTACKVSDSTSYAKVEFCPTDSSKCKYTACQNGYTLNNGNCVCTGTGTKISGNSCVCNSSVGYEGTPPNCTAKGCAGDYSSTITSCDIGYTLSCSGYSGGKKCCKCTCAADATCTAANYPLESEPSNANYNQCTPGCGDNTPRYVITSCKDGYELSGNACVAKQEPQGIQCCISSNNKQYSPIGRYLSDWNSYDGCESGGNTYGIVSPQWKDTKASIHAEFGGNYYIGKNYDTFKRWLDEATPVSGAVNTWTMVMGICGDIETGEDISIKNNNELTVHLIPCPVETGKTPKSYAISSDTSIELGGDAVSVSMNYSAPVLILHSGVSLYNSLVKADEIYLKGKVFFDNVKIEPLYSDHVDIYVGSYDDEGYNCYANSYLDDGNGYIIAEAERCAPMIGFYSSKLKYEYQVEILESYRYKNYDWYGTIDPAYRNVWGTPDNPVIFHKETDNTLDGIMFSKSLEDVTIYGYNGDSSPIFSEFKFYNYRSGDVEPTSSTMKLNLKSYASNTKAPLFRRFQTFEPGNSNYNVELNIYKDFQPSGSDNTKVTSVVNEIKSNSYLTSEETCSLGTASSYVHARDYDTTD